MSYDGRIRCDARQLPIADSCVQCVVTSPPYWGLRDYGQSGQIGLESTPEAYVASLVGVFREVWRVLKNDGVAWLNLGDSYCGGGNYRGTNMDTLSEKQRSNRGSNGQLAIGRADHNQPVGLRIAGLKPKDLVGIPWRVVFALQADGWWLRSDVIWSKPNPMPESVTDRPTRAHEYIFLLTKAERYYFDAEAIMEPVSGGSSAGASRPSTLTERGLTVTQGGKESSRLGMGWDKPVRNKRSVWHIGTRPYPEAHYATFPEEIPEICIKAGSRPGDFVLDPFAGSNTTGRVAERLSRRWIACDLGYQDLQGKRLTHVQKELVEVPCS